jgi:putative peptide zinc metalloprotease protein
MNLTRALDVALPEIPARTLAQRPPRLDPGTTFREHLEDGKMVARVYVPSIGGMFKLTPQQWHIAQLFDGQRSYQDIAGLYSQQTGVQYDAEEIREFAGDLDAAEFWYKTAQEKNILLMQQSTEERRKKLKTRSKWADLSIVVFPAYNPDKFLTWLYNYTEFIYTPWFTILTLIGFAITLGISISHWSEIGRDTIEFYNFTHKTWGDVFILYALGMFVVAAHEYGHAHACKHYGGRVPAMGFALVYLTPAFYTDTTEGAVKGSRYQRLIISLAGIWAELIICSIATPIWWGTPPDSAIHDGAYFLMMLTGFMSLIVNWNPLMKLDGYHMLCEVLGIADLKEESTAYTSSWVRKHVWRLPAEVPYVPKRRRLGYVVYAILSGAYSYTVLYIVARFAGNVSRNFNPDWSFIPEIVVALFIFRSRIRLLVNFMKFVYLDKKDRVVAWFTPGHSLAVAALLALLLLLPLKKESVQGRFVLEPGQTATIRPHVPGVLTSVFVSEGQQVPAGAPLAALRNLPLQSDLERSRARLAMASDRVKDAALHYDGLGAAVKEREFLAADTKQLSSEMQQLQLTSPISGRVITPRVQDRVGSYVQEGSEVLQVADLSNMRARIYISEFDLRRVHPGAAAKVQIEGLWEKWDAQTISTAATSTEMDPELVEAAQLKGLNAPKYYLVELLVPNSQETLRPGMTGVARVYGQRRSLLAMGAEGLMNFFGRKLW